VASPKLVLDATKRQCELAEERFEGYRHELLVKVADVLGVEKAKPGNVVQKIEDQLNALGDQIWHQSSSNEPTA
jgi:hypothetical protein